MPCRAISLPVIHIDRGHTRLHLRPCRNGIQRIDVELLDPTFSDSTSLWHS